jgi:hypothetical protein
MAFRLDERSLSLCPDSESRASVSSNLPNLYAPPLRDDDKWQIAAPLPGDDR